MPKLELKVVQKELEQGRVWPLYWLYGLEKLKSRELLKRIRKAVLGSDATSSSNWAWSEEVFEGSEADAHEILDAAQSPSLGGGTRLLVIRDAHALKSSELLSELTGPAQPVSELMCVCVCLAKDIDARKKFSKVLLEKAAVVPCEEVSEDQRDPWIHYLAKRRGIELTPSIVMQLCSLDPWSLDRVEQELEKFAVAGLTSDVILEEGSSFKSSDGFLEGFFCRDLNAVLPQVSEFSNHPDISLPLLGLLTWNVRHLILVLSDRANGTRHTKLSPYVADRFKKWSSKWSLVEAQTLQSRLLELDFSSKQTPLLPLGLWTDLVTQFCS